MKRILAILIVLSFVVTGVAYGAHSKSTSGVRTSLGVGEIRGQGDLPSDAHKTFRFVRFVQPDDLAVDAYPINSRISKDTIVIWQTVSGDDGVTVTLSNTSGDSRVAGVLAAEAITQETQGNTAAQDRGKDNWTWLQTYGVAEVTMGKKAKAVEGAALGLAGGTENDWGTAGTFTADAQTTTDDGTEYGNAGFFMDAGTEGETDVTVFIRTE